MWIKNVRGNNYFMIVIISVFIISFSMGYTHISVMDVYKKRSSKNYESSYETVYCCKDARRKLKSKNYEAALESIDRDIEKRASAEAYYWKGQIYQDMAINAENIYERADLYSAMQASYQQAHELNDMARRKYKLLVLLDQQLFGLWSEEYNEGVKYVSDDEVKASVENPIQYAIGHFTNALNILPDTIYVHGILAQLYASEDNYDKAIDHMNDYISSDNYRPNADDYYNLFVYYYQANDEENKLAILEQAHQLFPTEIRFIEQLTDLYFSMDEVDKAIELLEQLIALNEANINYRVVMASQLTGAMERKNTQLRNIYRDASQNADDMELPREEIQQLNGDINILFDKIKSNLDIVESMSDQPDYAEKVDFVKYLLSVLYLNRALLLYDESRITEDNKTLLEDAEKDFQQARIYGEEAVDIKEKSDYWGLLSQIYTYLNMNDKAQEALDRSEQ